jgi:hypothetical protein
LFILTITSFTAASHCRAQAYRSANEWVADSTAEGGGQAASPVAGVHSMGGGPLSSIALGVSASTLGGSAQAALYLNRRMNLRATGSYFNYTIDSIKTSGFTISATPTFQSAGASLDFYPFPRLGFRLSPGVLFYNKNGATGTFTAQPGTSFTLNSVTYYASSTNPILGTGSLGLHTQNPGYTGTIGWGNMIPRKGGHWSVPFELGVAYIGAPTVNVALTSGQACDANGLNCVNVATDPNVQANLAAQVAKYTKDLDPLKTYPIFSLGLAYSFHIR